MLKAVIDTNVWFSALISAGTPKKLIECWLIEGLFLVIYPQWLIDELRQASSKRRLAARVHPNDLQDLIKFIEEDGFLVEPEHIPTISLDPKDDVFLACAVASQSDFLVSGDNCNNDLLCLKEYKGVQIVTPKQFLEILATV